MKPSFLMSGAKAWHEGNSVCTGSLKLTLCDLLFGFVDYDSFVNRGT